MKLCHWVGYGSLLSGAILALIPFASAEERPVAPAIVSHNCSGCHELDGRSQLPYIPRLAGLSAAYTERKLGHFRSAAPTPVDEAVTRIVRLRSKDSGLTRPAKENMIGMAHALSDEDIRAAAAWYAAQKPAPGRSGNRKLIEAGKSVFARGVQSQGLPACQSCHAADAQGTNMAPRLAGQNAGYLLNQLALFRAGDPHHSPEMTVVAKNIEAGQARAVAAYLQSR